MISRCLRKEKDLGGRKPIQWQDLFLNLPAPAYYATGLAMAIGLIGLSWKMEHSRKWHKPAAIPQLLAIAGYPYGFKTNL